MEVDIRFQVASCCFYLIIATQFFSTKRLPTTTNKIFRAMVLVCGFNLIFDIATVYSLHYYEVVPWYVNRMLHQFFIGSLDLFIALLCLFVISLVHNLRVHRKKHILMFIPFVISIIVVMFGKLQYHIDGTVRYSYGMIAYTVYISVALYLFITIIYLVRYKKIISKRMRYSVFAAIAGEAIGSCIQLYEPSLLLSGLIATLIITFVFYSMVNPSEYIEKETGILNRYAFTTMLNETFGSKKQFYVVNVSFDDWGALNTGFGQKFSFQIMSMMAKFMEETFYTSVYHSRTKCLSLIIDDGIDRVREIARNVFLKLEDSIVIDQTSISLKPHILAIDCPIYAQSREDISKILELYIQKKFREKEKEKKATFYDKEDQAMLERYITIERMLKEAVEQDGFNVVYQPIYSIEKNYVNSCEALVRLKDTKTIGFVSPEEFILIAERIGVIGELGKMVFRKVCDFAVQYQLQKKGIEYIEVNLSAVQYLNPNLAEELISIMRDNGLPGNFFNFEITESAALEDNSVIQKNVKRLLNVGCSFSMDDYGTGYSNLSMMIDMPYHIIKLDKSLIWSCYPPKIDDNQPSDLAEKRKSHVILNSSVSMIKNLDYHIVAEGVENREQLAALISMGVDYIQGYYFSKPVDGETFYNRIEEWNAISR